jgi:deoxynucleoside triphosphate triphosphohydrolase SAMHD1
MFRSTEDDEFIISSQVSPRGAPHVKVVNDPIHSHFSIEGIVLDVLDTPTVQRLRDLKQLGGTSLVYPGATHSRFEHSLGCSYLSGKWTKSLYNNTRDPNSGDLFDNVRHFRDATSLVETAALCHDLGHGPFSHMFDHVFLPAAVMSRSGNPDNALMQHEMRSVMLFENLVDVHKLDLDREQVRTICALITGSKPIESSGLAPAWLYDVVANETCGVDADKLDYIQRDAFALGRAQGAGIDCNRILGFSKVVRDGIVFHRKEVYNIHSVFLSRYQMHREIYNHKAAISLDHMISDAMLLADQSLEISDAIGSSVQFLRLTDYVLREIENSRSACLADARSIVRRIRCRKLYRFCDEHLMPAGGFREITELDVTTSQDAAKWDIDLKPEDIVVSLVVLNFGRKDRNPLDSVMFFKDWSDMNPRVLPSGKVSLVFPTVFEERLLRVYLRKEFDSKSDEHRAMAAVKDSFRRCIRRMQLGSPLPSPVQRTRPAADAPSSDTESDVVDASRLEKRMRRA